MASATEARPGLRERKKLETRRRILAVAARMLSEEGFAAFTVGDLADAAGVARATFFNYFPGKSAVVRELGAQMATRFHHLVEDVRSRPGRTTDRLEELFAECATRLVQTPALSRAILEEAFARHQDAIDRMDRISEIRADFSALLQDGIDRGDVRIDLPLSLLVEITTGAFTEVQFSWMSNPTYPIRQNLIQTARFLGDALAPPASR